MNSQENWPFDQPSNAVTFTVRQIMDGTKPILLACHDADDHGWQFLTGEPILMKDALLVALKEIVSRDESICELANMPPGWQASRAHTGAPWEKSVKESEE